jgi:hypothetical protein
MPKIAIDVPHALGEEEAAARIKNLLADMKQKYASYFTDLQEEWSGNDGRFKAKAMGFNVSGAVDVQPARVSITGDLPKCSTCAYWRPIGGDFGRCEYMASSQGLPLEDGSLCVAFPDELNVFDGQGAHVTTQATFGCDGHPDRRGLSPWAKEAIRGSAGEGGAE